MVIASVIRRHMKKSPAFRLACARDPIACDLGLRPGERLVGIYANPSPGPPCSLAFSTAALYAIGEGGIKRVPWEDMIGWINPTTKSEGSLTVKTRDGECTIIIRGRHGEDARFADVFSLMMVVGSVVEHNLRAEQS